MENNYPGSNQNYKVLVRCFTYNQSQYIEDALNGFAIQQTNFPFVCLVVDDCSTDGEQDVISSWLYRECDMKRAQFIDIPTAHIVIVTHILNSNCTMAVYLLKTNLYKQKEQKMAHVSPWRNHCEYEALCEGDDYWIDPLKLQKQVDYLEKHPECGLVHAKAKMFNQKNNKFCHKLLGKSFDDFGELILENKIVTNTVLCREGILNSYRQESSTWKHKEWLMGDYPLWLYFAHKSKVHMLDDVVSVYRVLEESASHSKDLNQLIAFLDSIFNIQSFFANLYNMDSQTKTSICRNYKFKKCTLLFRNGELKSFFIYLYSFSFSEKLVYLREKLTHVLHLNL